MKTIKIKDMVRGDCYATDRVYIINLDNVRFVEIESDCWDQFDDGGVPESCGYIGFYFLGNDDTLGFTLKHGKAKDGYETYEEVLERLERILEE
jgi:hypothetical protein